MQVARAAWDANGAIIVTADLPEAMPLIDRLAPEHLEIATDDPEPLFDRVRHAGSVFLGRYTPEAVGDYVAGPNHVLPTGRRARFASGLSVLDFMKRTSFLQCDAASLAAIGPAAVALAHAEGLPAHARSVLLHEFHQHRLGAEIEGAEYADAEVDFFDDIVTGALTRGEEIDRLVAARLSAGWSLDRLDKPMKAILRAGAYELLARADVSVPTVISEYVDVAHAFYDRREAGFVNGLLDAVAKDARI